MPSTPRIFVSYSHKDETPWKTWIVSHLRVAERQGDFTIWDDRQIRGGDAWRAEIEQALASSDIAVLLISRHFLSSDFVMDHEVQAVLRRSQEHGMSIYPILITPCTWKRIGWLASLNIRPTDGVPLSSFREADRDQVMADMAAEIGRSLHQDEAGETLSDDTDASVSRPAPPPEIARSMGVTHWWRSSSTTIRATVLGTVFGGLALLWGVVSTLVLDVPACDAIASSGGVVVCDDVTGDIQTQAGPANGGAN